MLDFSLNLIIFISLALVVFVLGRGLSRVDKVGVSAERRPDVFEKIDAVLQLKKIDDLLNRVFKRSLHRVRLTALKIDNLTHNRLNKIGDQGTEKKELSNSVLNNNLEDNQK